MFYLARGPAAGARPRDLLDSEWALTSISQRQFWRGSILAGIGGVLSVDISEWQRAGRRTGKVAALCTPRRSARRSGASSPTTSTTCSTASRSGLVPRRGDRVPEPLRRDQRRAAARQHQGLVGRPAGRGHAHPKPGARRRLRAHLHRPGDDGGRERGRPPRGQRDPRRRRIARRALRLWPLREPPALRPARALDKLLWRLRRPPLTPVRVERRARCGRRPAGGRRAGSRSRPPPPGSRRAADGRAAPATRRARRGSRAGSGGGGAQEQQAAEGQPRPEPGGAAGQRDLARRPRRAARRGCSAASSCRARGRGRRRRRWPSGLASARFPAVVAKATRRPSAEIDGSVA